MTPYAQKREQKLGRSVQLALQPPRYLSPEHLIGITSKHTFPANASPVASAPHLPRIEKTKDDIVSSSFSTVPPLQECSTGLCAQRSEEKQDSQEGTVKLGSFGGKITSFDPVANELVTAKSKPIVPPKKILKLVGQAISDWGMIQEVCLPLTRSLTQTGGPSASWTLRRQR
jgi:hypothetical protein